MRIAAYFDIFSQTCPFSVPYGECTHPEQENRDYNEENEEIGHCSCIGCPLGTKAEPEDINCDDIDWDTADTNNIDNTDYLLVVSDHLATDDASHALSRYMNYIHRYDQTKNEV